MNKITSIVRIMLGLALLPLFCELDLRAALIAYDGANYNPTTSINGLSGGTGWNGGWAGNDNVVAGSLTINGVATNGNRFVTDGNNTGSFRTIATAGHADLLTNGKFGKDGTTLWLSFLFRAETTVPNNYAGLSLYDGTTSQQLYIGVPTGQSPLALYAPGGAGNFSATPISGTNLQTYFLVVKMVFAAGFADKVFLFVNPTLDSQPADNTRAAILSNINFQFDRILIASGQTATTASFDEIRFGETWDDVAPLAMNRLVFSELRRFGNTNQMGANPLAGVVEGDDGALYGTTIYGGVTGLGTVYKMNKDGTGYRVLWNFQLDAKGQSPNAIIRGSDGALYGTCPSFSGGTAATVFKLNQDGSGFTVLHTFGGSPRGDGFQPTAGVIEGSDHALYGTTLYGGTNNLGTVFKVNKDGSGYQVLRQFQPKEGNYPRARLLEGLDGALYGVTTGNNTGGHGAIFKINKDGSGYQIIHTFSGFAPDFAAPDQALLQGSDSALYGLNGRLFKINTDGSGFAVVHAPSLFSGEDLSAAELFARAGGVFFGCTASSIFKINQDGSGYTNLHVFNSIPNDGEIPVRPAALFFASDGAFYGTTTAGGSYGTRNGGYAPGEGSVFKIMPDGSGYAIVQSFNSAGGDGASARGGVIHGSDDALYGTTRLGGASGVGAVYKINRDGGGYTLLKSFNNSTPDGRLPVASVLEGSDGALYGTCSVGGSKDIGTVYKLNKDGSGYATLVDFKDAANPTAPLIEGKDGALYGTTHNGGPPGTGYGAIFKVNKDGSGYSVIKGFAFNSSDGRFLDAPLCQASDLALYGAASSGGAKKVGTIFKINTDGSGFTVLHACSFTVGDVSLPEGGLIEASDGKLYGLAQSSGLGSISAAYRLNKDGSGFTVLSTVGATPYGSLLEWTDGLLYGASSGGSSGIAGSLFRLAKDGSSYELLYTFARTKTEEVGPWTGLTDGGDGALYGTTDNLGNNVGTIFKFGPASASPPQNHPPTLAGAIADQFDPPGTAFTLTLPANTFADADAGQSLTYSASGLPPGIVFDATTRTFSGTPTQKGNYLVTITVTDNGSPPLTATASFNFLVATSRPVVQTLTKVLQFGGPNQARAGLVEGPDGTLYGRDGGTDTNLTGSIFRVKKDGSGFAVLHAFAGTPSDGDGPTDLIFGSDGTLYGIASDTQAKTFGHVFALSTNGGSYRVVRQWNVIPTERASPFGVTEGSDGALYGVAGPGGTLGSATIWKLNKDGSGYQILHDFEAGLPSPNTTFGDYPNGKVIEGVDGKLYGLATGGSANLGVVFRINKDGSSFENIHEFTGSGQGSGPFGQLRYTSDGFFYGIGHNGGTTNHPVVFKLRPDGSAYQPIVTADVANFNVNNRPVESSDGFLYGTSSGGGQFVSGTIYRVYPDGSGFESLHDFSLVSNPPLGIQPTPPLHGSDGNLYFITQQQTGFSVTQPQWQFILLRFGPVPQPPAIPNSTQIVLQFGFSIQGGPFTISFTGQPGVTYDIQAASALPGPWQSLSKPVADAAGNVQFVDTSAPGQVTRFYRVVRVD